MRLPLVRAGEVSCRVVSADQPTHGARLGSAKNREAACESLLSRVQKWDADLRQWKLVIGSIGLLSRTGECEMDSGDRVHFASHSCQGPALSCGVAFPESDGMKPLLKWAGGKRAIAPVIAAHLPEDWQRGRYFEPFIGGAAMFLYLNPKDALLADMNPHLIDFYRTVQANPDGLLDQISELKKEFDSAPDSSKAEVFYDMRNRFNDSAHADNHAALLFALNKLCFNGLFRVNSAGKFNVPFGHKKVFPDIDTSGFKSVSERLAVTEIVHSDFENAVQGSQEGDFVYFDPPYIPITETSSFTSYAADGFDIDDQKRLASLMKELHRKGVKAVLSNSATALTSEVYVGLRQVTIQAPRMVSASGAGRGTIDELLVFNF